MVNYTAIFAEFRGVNQKFVKKIQIVEFATAFISSALFMVWRVQKRGSPMHFWADWLRRWD